MPAYNAGDFIYDAIQSVINQNYKNWQLLVINDGSEDETEKVVLGIHDDRIRYYHQENRGVSAARNVGLSVADGEYVCFLDADDVLTPNSLNDRAKYLNDNPGVDFVDGIIYVTGASLVEIRRVWRPLFRGCPKEQLIRLKDNCFLTISWMIRKAAIAHFRFHEGISHGEDLIFLAQISADRVYDCVDAPILYFRRSGATAMSNLDGLANGYCQMFEQFEKAKLFNGIADRIAFKMKIMRIMFLSYCTKGQIRKAFNFLLRVAFN